MISFIFGNIYNDMGVYYEKKENNTKMLEYYGKAIEYNNSFALCNLGRYYKNINDIPRMIHFYERAIEKGNKGAMYNLAQYYENIGNEAEMFRLIKMSADLNCSEAMNSLGVYYEKKMNYDKMFEYYLKAIRLKNNYAMCNLAKYYEKKNNCKEMLKYYEMAVKYKNINSMIILGEYYEKKLLFSKMLTYYTLVLKDNNENKKIKIKNNIIQCFKNNIYSIEIQEWIEKEMKKYDMNSFMLKQVVKICLDNYELTHLFFKLYEKNKFSIIFFDFHLFFTNKIKMKTECSICFTDNSIVFPFDCCIQVHSFCISCYTKMEKCPLCGFIKRNKFFF